MAQHDEMGDDLGEVRVRQNISLPTALLVVAVATAIFLVVFSRPHWGPQPRPVILPPQVPEVSDSEIQGLRKGLMPMGIVVVMPPLPQDRGKGVRVAGVVPGSPAYNAGLRAGDLITSFAGEATPHPGVVVYLLESVEPGKKYTVGFVRSGEKQTAEITGITPLPPEERAR